MRHPNQVSVYGPRRAASTFNPPFAPHVNPAPAPGAAGRDFVNYGKRDMAALEQVQASRPRRIGECSMPTWLDLYR